MKRTSILISIVMLFGIISTQALAADLRFNPESATLSLLPGEAGATEVVANLDSPGISLVNLAIDSSDSLGNLPPGWLKPVNTYLVNKSGGTVSKPIALEVIVPFGVANGRYKALLKPQILRTTEPVNSGEISLVVQVGPENECDGALALENLQVGPESVWAPTDTEVVIEVSGTVVSSPGCEVNGFYSMESNNGPVAGSLDIDTGSFVQQIVIMVSKQGKDKEGTTYQGAVSVEDEVGNKASQEFFVMVDHDRHRNRERNPKNK